MGLVSSEDPAPSRPSVPTDLPRPSRKTAASRHDQTNSWAVGRQGQSPEAGVEEASQKRVRSDNLARMTTRKRHPVASVLRFIGRAAELVVVSIMTLWAVMMLHYSNLPWGWLRCRGGGVRGGADRDLRAVRAGKAAAVAGACSALLVVMWAMLVVWFRLIPPSQSRDWQADVERTPRVTIDGERVTIENVHASCTGRKRTSMPGGKRGSTTCRRSMGTT